MKAAVVTGAGAAPAYLDFADPIEADDSAVVTVTASALSHITRGRAAGTHYSAGGGYPFVAGIDGVGRLADGRRVYFLMPVAPFGGMAERALVDRRRCIDVPEGLDDVTAAALAIPGMSSWAAFTERAKLTAGETVLINGATGASGRLAVQIARHLGAGRIIATGRNAEALRELPGLGADLVVPLLPDGEAFEAALLPVLEAGVDVVIDYLWGASAERLLTASAKAGREGVALRYVEVGALSGGSIALPAGVLRATGLQLMGSGTGSVSGPGLRHAVTQVMAAAGPAKLRIATRTVPLAEVASAWAVTEGGARTVFVP